MQAGSFTKAILLGICLVLFAGCEDGGGFGANNFQGQYEAARGALEKGKYDKANQLYAQLLTQAGPLEPRIRLEYSHSLLRSEDYAEASKQAFFLAQGQTDTARSAALAVAGTAEHELGLAAIQQGQYEIGKRHLISAQSAISEVLAKDPELDPLGALASRQKDIQTRLKALG